MIRELIKLFIQEHIRVLYCKNRECVFGLYLKVSFLALEGSCKWFGHISVYFSMTDIKHDLLVTFDRQKTALICV